MRHAPRHLAQSLAVAIVVSCPGCSFMFAYGPPDGHEQLRYFDCTSSEAAPATDTLLAADYAVISTLIGAGAIRVEQRAEAAIGVGILAAVLGTSAVYGWVKTGSCDHAKARMADRISERERAYEARVHELEQSVPPPTPSPVQKPDSALAPCTTDPCGTPSPAAAGRDDATSN